MPESIYNKEKTASLNSQKAEYGKKLFRDFIDNECPNAEKVSYDFLMKLLNDNKDTEYGKKYDFANIKTIEDFQKKVPVVTYENIEPLLERMKNGEKDILTCYPFTHMNQTSGTKGAPKLVPLTSEQAKIFEKYSNLLMYGAITDEIGTDWISGRAFCPTSGGNCHTEPSGITVGDASSQMARYIQGGEQGLDTMLRTMFTSPVEATIPAAGTDVKYVHTRFALMDKDITGVISGFYVLFILQLQYIADNYKLLIDDIEKGTISENIEMPDEVRKSLLSKIQPMPERAAELREIFKNGSDFRFMQKVWPNMKFIFGVGADGFSVYTKTIKERFGGDYLNFFYCGITASEGLWSVCIGKDNPDSAIAAGSAFMEFLPVDADGDFSKIVTMDKVEVGKVYELIITNLCGFYRYRMSDAVLVTGKLGQAPLVQFMYRVNKTINLAAEKTTEKMLQIVVEKTCDELKIPLSDFSVYPDGSVTPPQYVFLIETLYDMPDPDNTELKKVIFKNLCEVNPEYKECYDDKWLQAPDAYFLQPQTMALYRDKMVMQGASMSQLKPVRVIEKEEQRKFFFILRQ